MKNENSIPSFVFDALHDPKLCDTEDFKHWLEDEENNRQLFDDMLCCHEALSRLQPENEPDIEAQWLTVSKKTVAKVPTAVRRPLRTAVKIVITTAAAIAILLIMAWNNHKNKDEQVQNPTSQTIVNTKESYSTPNGQVIIAKAETRNQPITVSDDHGHSRAVNSKILSYITQNEDTPPRQLTLTTPRGKSIKVTLNDSTEIWLNGESSLSYPSHFTGDTRTVRLTGEAFFKVAHDSRHPFIVEHDGITTKALGTAFNIRSYNGAKRHITLVNGSVMVTDSTLRQKEILKPGEDLAYNTDLSEKTIKPVDTNEYTSWTEGLFYFDNTELSDIMQVLGRWYNVTVIFSDDKSAHYHFSFWADRNASLSETLALLNQIGTVKVQHDGSKRQVVIRKR